MRESFINTLESLANQDPDIFLLTADMGFSVFEGYQKRFKDRFINVGIAEANMASISAGLALSGKKVFAYTFAPFAIMRCFEQIRLDICYHNLNVKIVGLGGGITYGKEGVTHQAIEDIAIMRALPNMTVLCPGDPIETEIIVRESVKLQGPAYIRIGKKGEENVHRHRPDLRIGKALVLEKGKDIAILATGNMLHTGSVVVSNLKAQGLHPMLVSMHTLKPLDEDFIRKTATDMDVIYTLEEHSAIGGLTSAVSQVLATSGFGCRLKGFSLGDSFIRYAGASYYLRDMLGLSPEKITAAITEDMARGING